MQTSENYDTIRLDRMEQVIDNLTCALERAHDPDMRAMWASKVRQYLRLSRGDASEEAI
jgi:hypothetical protein